MAKERYFQISGIDGGRKSTKAKSRIKPTLKLKNRNENASSSNAQKTLLYDDELCRRCKKYGIACL